MKTAVIIPARMGSMRFPGKVLADLGGKPVIQHVWENAMRSKADSVTIAADDPRTNARIDFIGGIRGTGELERLCNEGLAAVCFSMYPTTLDQLMDIADAGSIMPPKSTWFEPKLRDGLVSHDF